MKRLYAIYDKKSESYGPVFGVAHDAVAIREFGAAIETPNSSLARYADDFELHCVAQFDDVRVATDVASVPVQGVIPAVVITARAWLSANAAAQERLKLEE